MHRTTTFDLGRAITRWAVRGDTLADTSPPGDFRTLANAVALGARGDPSFLGGPWRTRLSSSHGLKNRSRRCPVVEMGARKAKPKVRRAQTPSRRAIFNPSGSIQDGNGPALVGSGPRLRWVATVLAILGQGRVTSEPAEADGEFC